MPTIYHLTSQDTWTAAQDAAQMLRVALRLYPGREDLLALAVDTGNQVSRQV